MDTDKPSALADKIHAAKERREKLQRERDAARSGITILSNRKTFCSEKSNNPEFCLVQNSQNFFYQIFLLEVVFLGHLKTSKTLQDSKDIRKFFLHVIKKEI